MSCLISISSLTIDRACFELVRVLRWTKGAVSRNCGPEDVNLSNLQIATELGLNKDDVQAMTQQLREGVEKKSPVSLSCSVERDEVYVKAGYKGNAAQVVRAQRPARCKERRGRGALAKNKQLIFGIIKCGRKVVIRILENVKQTTTEPKP